MTPVEKDPETGHPILVPRYADLSKLKDPNLRLRYDGVSRQQERALLREVAQEAVNQNTGASRRERRAMARAVAKRAKEIRRTQGGA